ncbi:MAG: NAD(P)H-binding protein [Bacilli bacterium]|nr:NAD(P)H-binding protein [Bacilli bacterium]
MKIAIIGANGKAGRLIVQEAIDRGHDVLAIVRDRTKLDINVDVLEKDVLSLVGDDFKGVDVLINAMGAGTQDPILYQIATRHMIEVLSDLPNLRYLVVGGAGSLFTDSTMSRSLYETEQFPKSIYPTAMNMAKALERLRESQIRWSFFSPAIQFDSNGRKTGEYQLGSEWVILNQAQESYISYPDYVIALLDEVENPQFICKRFTAVGER